VIPKIIHQCWFGPKPVPERHRAWMEGVRAAMPDFRHRLWGNGDLPDNRFVRECLEWKKYALLSDWMRMRALWEEGGFYLDTDVEARKSFEPLSARHCVLGLEPCMPKGKPVANAIMGAEPRHPFIGACLERFEDGLNRRLKPPYGVKVVNLVLFGMGFSGTRAQRVGDVDILEVEVLYKEYAIHHYEGSWHSRKDFMAKMKSLGYRSGRGWIQFLGRVTGRRMYPGDGDGVSTPWKTGFHGVENGRK